MHILGSFKNYDTSYILGTGLEKHGKGAAPTIELVITPRKGISLSNRPFTRCTLIGQQI